ncbi:rho guanine nucleotide exchange factor 10-like protein isoform X2 [Bombus vosnesenskii]|uniref:Rho guanine nucleotide exchange factor 10-like protein isoform X2 n=2 Tax=Pyrobombus TaxID=144703 RepID=A0A6J3KES8_9HYME|nr:rho guanine nucleotide exchange factor 10-like protein isoform X2 [Bombus impatiens]XP_033197594.1 rho guanine nucleotide exchange factor 10-like protein isoform X2 [Bombus vancouverensis nearcticus]XP_033350494.1 rho guanine nucleotide exchange factor 10-like protein isoform X2 [Bombus vosnesenskii]XP_050488175.1 rho guanine nucleotide exchange factor 10-like protein isoform X2 [Bombus huntii]
MASSLGGPGMASGVPSPRRVNLEFPPPPPYPPPHSQMACPGLVDPGSVASPMASSAHQHPLQDYSYAYFEPGPSRLHGTYPAEVGLNRVQPQQQQQLRADSFKRHTYMTRYGTEENIYEEISEIKQCHRALHGSRRSLVAEEVRRVQSRHRRVLGELNLSVEAMLMPTVADNNDEDEPQDQRGASTEELLSSVSPTDDLLSPVGCDMDSGFSGSSSASYRSGLGSLRRGMGKTSTPELAGGQRKTKAAMIWKKGWKGWKKLHSFGNNSNKTDEPRSRCRSWDDVGPTKMETVGQTHRQHHPSLEATRSNTSTQSARSEDSWCSASDHDLSSDDESEKSNISIKSNCQLRNTLHKARTLCDKWRPQNMRVNNADPLDSPGNHGRLSRWFSIRRGSTQQYDVDSSDTVSLTSPIKTPQMPQLCEVEEENSAMVQFQCMQQRRQTPPALPPTPPNLTPQQLKRRHIVAAIVHSENSYVSTLQRLVNDYKKPLEESSPPILSQAKIATLFHRLPEILQCHTLFRIALAECVRSWDKDEKLGDVFVASFSKAIVLDIYSGFINNFSVAMDLAKQESKRKTALADFFKVKQISAHDRLSFFGLMVKPVQRFPQFILFLQDLLKHTPQGHHDRMSLQLALTQLESLAEMLNERKREAEQFQAFKEMLRHVSGKLSHRPLSSSSRYLIREDNVTQLEFNQNGMITKSKRRRLLLLNDLVVCVSVTPRSAEDFSGSERLTLKWTYPVSDIEIQDTSTSPTLSRLLTAGLNKCGSLKSDKSGDCGQVGADSLCVEMNDLMHDYEVMSRISDLVAQLKGKYEGMTLEKTKQILQSIQLSIQQKDEDMVWADSCCLQLVTKQGQMYTFQTENPLVKKDWITELRLAQLALDPNNSPSWEVPEQEQRPSTKMPLFVSSQQVYHSQHQTEVRCGCYYTTQNPRPTRRRGRSQSYLWICTGDGISSHVTVFGQSTTASASSLKQITAFDLVETRVAAIEFVKGVSSDPLSLASDLVWMGTDSRKILIYIASEPEKQEELGNYSVSGPVIQIKYHCDNVFVALGIGLLLLFKRQVDGTWNLRDPFVISLGSEPVSCLMPINASVYAACGKKVWVLNAVSGDITKSFSAQHEHVGSVKLMAHSGVGLWVALKNSSTVCLYHTETFKHLQDINIASNVLRVTRSNNASNSCGDNLNNNQTAVTVTALLACKGLLWVGTNVGISLTIPLPRLEGVPIISGRVNISYHAHFGPITFLLAIQNPKNTISCTTDEIADEETVQLRSKESDSSRNRDRASLDSSMSNSILKLKQQLASSPVMLRRKRSKEYEYRGSKTLPRGLGSGGGFLSSSMSGSQSSGENCDVYGLYGELMYVKDYENENSSGIDLIYEPLRRSDPELAAIPNKVSTLDRRLKMKITRPRSLDLSNWSVDSHASSLYTSSGSEENLSLKTGKLSRNSSTASRNGPYETTTPNSSIAQSVPETISPPNNLKTNGKKINKTLQQIEQPKKTVLTLMGGRGYINWRQLNAQSVTDKGSKSGYTFKDPNSNDAHIVLWEMKL